MDATCKIINNPDISIGELCVIMRGPDLRTRGAIVGKESIKRHLSIGRGIMKMHGLVAIEEGPSAREPIVISEIPYDLNEAMLVTRIAEFVHEKFSTKLTRYATNRMKMPAS
jgi:DNA gyrase subunit A